MTDDERYMLRALELASLGMGCTAPNPMVGAVLVHEGRIIGEGYHHRSGMPHAEVMAVASVQERDLLSQSTLYVTLEPCSHYGKTPPCAELIIRERIPRVVVATQDPFPQVSGRGIQLLRDAGIEVIVGVLEGEARRLNAPFITTQTKHRPFVSLKWAQSLDGFIDRLREDRSESPEIFSSPLQQRLVHAERMRHDAILVGYRTALLDDPQLTNRLWYGRSPLRIVLDPCLQLPRDLRLFRDQLAPTWVIHLRDVEPPAEPMEGVRYLALDGERIEPSALLRLLHREGVQSLLVEGGASTLESFLESQLYDQLLVEVCPRPLGKGVPAPAIRDLE